jgi:DNA-binding NtrC family response regulator
MLGARNYVPLEAADGAEALGLFKQEAPSAVLLDLMLPDMNGIQVLQEMKQLNPEVPVIITTGTDDVQVAVQAIKLGAYEFIVKPLERDRLMLTLERAIEMSELAGKVKNLSSAVDAQFEQHLGRSAAIRNVIEQIRTVAASDFSIIIQGETGSGKNYFARLIHDHSKRAAGPYISIDMGAIPDTLAESELFGYEKGAFTGAERKKKGLFELAHGGTVLIDELQNMSPLLQSKLLRVAEERRFYPLGSSKPVKTDVRIISCTNTNIQKAVAEQRFREDLFFRLGEFTISLPPLRERTEDIPYLSERFFREAAEELSKQVRGISEEGVARLLTYKWPGNIRELKNVIRRAALLVTDGMLKPENILPMDGMSSECVAAIQLMPLKEITALVIREAESKAIRQALVQTHGNKTQAAKLLQIDYKTLFTKIKEYDIITHE